MKLVIVESPAKTHTIGAYLGSDFKVVSSKGHIRDLATSGKFGLGVDVDNNFEPNYVVIKGKNKDIKELKKDIKESEYVYLATDPDREGEAISWHLFDALGLKDSNYERIVFNEITKPAVLEAFNHSRKIDMDLVKSQETRRILDRIIGFRLSKLMRSKTEGSSAGRVQSVALKLVVDKEREIEAFIPEEYWEVVAHFSNIDSELASKNGKRLELHTKEEVDKVLAELGEEYKVDSIDKKSKKRNSLMPFITSTLQQACFNKYGFNSGKVMSIAQKLYEGIDIGSGSVGLITYMRTDSTRLSNLFINEAFDYIEKEFGKEYLGGVKTSKKKENVQDAHEAIRPTSVLRTPDSVKRYLSDDEYKVYSIIYARALASLMAPGETLTTTINLINNGYGFKTSGTIETFDGFLKVYRDFMNSDEKALPDLKTGEVLLTRDVEASQKFTKPPARYTEATLIEEMEKLGIGRPSTYAQTMKTIKDRDYVSVKDKRFIPTEVGIEVTDKLQEFFSSIINVTYTAEMETELDEIADNKLNNVSVLRNFYDRFEPLLEKALKEMQKKAPEETGETCPKCGSPMVIRKSRYGKFEACSNYPTCKYIKQEEKEEKEVKEVCKCSKCKDGMIIERLTRRNKVFYGCSNFPKCKAAYWDKPIGENCPICGEVLVEHDGDIKCSSCDYSRE